MVLLFLFVNQYDYSITDESTVLPSEENGAPQDGKKRGTVDLLI